MIRQNAFVGIGVQAKRLSYAIIASLALIYGAAAQQLTIKCETTVYSFVKGTNSHPMQADAVTFTIDMSKREVRRSDDVSCDIDVVDESEIMCFGNGKTILRFNRKRLIGEKILDTGSGTRNYIYSPCKIVEF